MRFIIPVLAISIIGVASASGQTPKPVKPPEMPSADLLKGYMPDPAAPKTATEQEAASLFAGTCMDYPLDMNAFKAKAEKGKWRAFPRPELPKNAQAPANVPQGPEVWVASGDNRIRVIAYEHVTGSVKASSCSVTIVDANPAMAFSALGAALKASEGKSGAKTGTSFAVNINTVGEKKNIIFAMNTNSVEAGPPVPPPPLPVPSAPVENKK